jgi:hypothetical protein
VAFVEELWSFKPSSRSTNILTSEFNVRRLYRTSPTPTHYCIDVWRIIGMWACVVFNCVSFTCEIDSDQTVSQVLRQFCVTPSTPQYRLGASQKLVPPTIPVRWQTRDPSRVMGASSSL